MRPNLAYRDVKETDFGWLLDLRRVTMNPHLVAAGFEPLENSHVEAVQTDYEWTRIIRAEDQDIGMIRLVKKNLPWHLRHLQILPEYQARGIGSAVLVDVLEQARNETAQIVLNVLKVNPARELYVRFGFDVVEDNDSAYKMVWCA